VGRSSIVLDGGGNEAGVAAAMSEVAVSEVAVANGLDAIQLFGGAGYLVGTGVERQLRDVVPSTIFSGTSDILRGVVAQETCA
jgi:clorobiocin biosynthesis protein CloN3